MLIGRAAECATVDGVIERARQSHGGVLLVRGQAGVGKTSLLDHAAATADVRVLRASGVQAESELAFAAAHQLLHPLLPLLDSLPGPQAHAVRVALGLADGGSPDRFLVALGFLSLISEAARSQPVVCLLDDVQWCDSASTDTMLFVGRRIAAEPVALLLAARDDPAEGSFAVTGIAELVVGGLGEESAGELLAAASGVPPPPEVRSDLARRTHGNPLALVELARALSPDQVGGRTPLPEVLPLGERVERSFLDRAAPLSDRARRLLLVAAADESGDPDVVVEAAGQGADALAEAEGSGLVTVRRGRLEFCHPLARSAVYADAAPSARRSAHSALAAALGARGYADHGAWHLAAATPGPDERVAAGLDEVAERARHRSAHGASSSAYERAAELSPHVTDRTRRLVAAASAAWLAGQAERTRLLVDRAEALATDPAARGRLLQLRAQVLSRRGEVADAHRLLLDGARLVRDLDPAAALEMLADAVEAAAYTGDLGRVDEAVTEASGLDPGPEPRTRFLARWLSVGHASMRGRVAENADALRETVALGERLDDPRALVWAGIAALNLGDVAGMQRFYRTSLDRARRAGAVGSLPYPLEHAAMALALAGSYPAARSAADEGLRLARETGQLRSSCHLLAILAFVAGMTGDEQSCHRYAREAVEIGGPLGLGLPVATATWALAKLDVATGRYDAAVDRLVALRDAKPGDGHPIIALWSTPDLVEAAARSRRLPEAQAALAALDDFALAGQEATAAATAAWCHGLLGGPDAAEQLAAAAAGYRNVLPMGEARARLALGELLRRERRPSAAREHLRAAFEAFQALGARPWAERAAAELRASGEAPQASSGPGIEQLTPQELQIIRYVCQGASNRDVAAQLFISPRTVEYHLYKAYPKLGISSRAQLISRFGGDALLAGATASR